jgi:hypothetical protein
VRVRKRWGSLDVELEPDALARHSCVVVDAFSVAASLSRPEELFSGFAEAGIRAIFVLDAWHETHLGRARRYLDLCGRYGLDCRLSERKPAEELAVELACAEGCAVLTRDYDAVRRALEIRCGVPILMAKGGGVYRVVAASF